MASIAAPLVTHSADRQGVWPRNIARNQQIVETAEKISELGVIRLPGILKGIERIALVTIVPVEAIWKRAVIRKYWINSADPSSAVEMRPELVRAHDLGERRSYGVPIDENRPSELEIISRISATKLGARYRGWQVGQHLSALEYCLYNQIVPAVEAGSLNNELI